MSSPNIQIHDIKRVITTLDNSILSVNEYYMLNDTIQELFDEYIKTNILSISNPYFIDEVIHNIKELLSIQFDFIDPDILSYTFDILIDKVMNIYFTHVMPRRSYKNTFIRKTPNVPIMQNKIQAIKNKPQPEQRTKEWYEFRHNLITASSAWKALDSQSSINSIIYEKCKPYDDSKYDNVNMNTPFHWGTKYEPISVQLYEYIYKTTVEDFGCIQHDTFKFIGASPDGINTNPESPLYGRMLEIKNIVNREINGIPKPEYWIQMQLQMEVCNLNECDFLETRFLEYDNYTEFMQDGTFTKTANDKQKGIFVLFFENGKPHYEYPPIDIDNSQFETWEQNIIEKNNHMEWIKNIYWKLDTLSCVLVLRNKLWFKQAVISISGVWDIIERERISGYDHRAPKKRNKSFDEKEKKNNCLLSFKDNEVSLYTTIHIETNPLKL